MGDVYFANDGKLERKVAIKVLDFRFAGAVQSARNATPTRRM